MSDLNEALENAVIFDRRDNIKHETGRAWETSRLIRDAARRYSALTSEETIEKGIEAAHSVVLVTEDGRGISVAGLLTLDHPELLRKVIEAVLRAVTEGDT